MKKRVIMTILIASIVGMVLCGCGNQNKRVDKEQDDERYENTEDTEEESEFKKGDRILDKKIFASYDKEFFENYNEAFRNSDSYDPVFENRCLYLDGNKVYFPTTVREFEKLFDTEFTKFDFFSGGYFVNYYNDDMELLSVLLPSEEEQEIMGDDFLDRSKDIEICGVIFQQKDPFNGGRDVWCRYQVEFESVEIEEVNEYGYYIGSRMRTDDICYGFYPACYQAYYEYINGTLPYQSFYSEFGFTMSSIIDYAGKDNIEIGFGDVTCDALSEMIIETTPDGYPEGFHDVRVYTYDTIDKELREIYYASMESDGFKNDYISVGTGVLRIETRINNAQEETRANQFIVFNRYGYSWPVASFNWRFDKNTYDKSCYANGREVSEDAYYDEMHIYDDGGMASYKLDDILDQLSNVAILTAQGVYRNNFAYAELKENISKLDLDAIGFDVNKQPEDSMQDYDYQMEYDEGYIDSTGEDSIFAVTVAAPDGGVNLRSGPGVEYDILVEMIPNGTYMDVFGVLEDSNGHEWYKVDYNSVKGYVAASQVSY